MYTFTLRSLLSSPAARLLSLLGSERPSRFFASCHNMLANAPSSPITTAPPYLHPRQDVTTTVDSAASSSSLLSVQMEVFGYFYGIEVTAPGTVTVPSEELYFECPDGAEDTWKEATTENQDLGQETSGQGCLVSYTGTFAQAWYMGAITWEAGVYGCQNWDKNETTWHWAYTPSSQIGQIMCIWEDLGGLGEHTVRVLNPSPGYNGGGQLWINGLIYATDTQVYTTQTGTVVPTHSAPSYTSGQSTSSTISSKPSNTQSSTSIAIATSDSASASLTADTASSTSTSSTDSPSSSASASSSPGLSGNQIILIVAICTIIFFALMMVYCLVCRRKSPSKPKGDGGPAVYVREVSVGKGMGGGTRRRRAVESESEIGSEWSGSGSGSEEEEGGWQRRRGGEGGEERRRMLR